MGAAPIPPATPPIAPATPSYQWKTPTPITAATTAASTAATGQRGTLPAASRPSAAPMPASTPIQYQEPIPIPSVLAGISVPGRASLEQDGQCLALRAEGGLGDIAEILAVDLQRQRPVAADAELVHVVADEHTPVGSEGATEPAQDERRDGAGVDRARR